MALWRKCWELYIILAIVGKFSSTCNISNMTLLTSNNEQVYGLWNTSAANDGHLLTVNTSVVHYYSGEEPQNAFDQRNSSKFNIGVTNCSGGGVSRGYCGINTGVYVTPQQGPTLLLAIQFTTANDATSRDPLSITVEGSNSNSSTLMLGTSWSLIYNGSSGLNETMNRTTDGLLQCISYSVTWYTSYRVLVTSIRNFGSDVQYSEVKLLGYGNTSTIATTSAEPPTTSAQKLTTSVQPSTTPVAQSTNFIPSIANQSCFLPRVALIPSTSSFSSPLQFRRSDDFSISADMKFLCNKTYPVMIRWIIQNCNSSCLFRMNFNNSIVTTSSELFIPGRTLPCGLYQFQIVVQSNYSANLSISSSAYAKINPTGIIANFVQSGTSMITRGTEQNVLLDPGGYSIDLDENSFNASNWIYKYYCRIYGFSTFPNMNNSLLTIDNPTAYSFNSSCLSTRPGNATSWIYKDSIQSSITILAGSLRSNRTYQFMVQMINRKDASQLATGYLLVKVQGVRPPSVAISCVISTLCVPNTEYQLVNPTTQVALYGVCIGNCTTLQKIQWNIYNGSTNSASNLTGWTLYNQTNTNNKNWFFGADKSNFTVINQLFLQNPTMNLWRFEVIYTFATETSSSSLNFLVNTPPANGTCSIHPFNGTTDTVFTVSCPNWFDKNNIKDYLLYFWKNNHPTRLTFVASSLMPQFQVRLPAGDLNLVVYIRDTADCVTIYNLSTITVQSDTTEIMNLMDNTIDSSTNPLIQLLSSGNQNTVGQVISSVSQQLNTMNNQTINQVISNGISPASISVSSLGSQRISQNSVPFNASAYEIYNENLNSQSNVREVLIQYMNNLLITTPNSIKLQSASLAELTQSTNQLTRQTLQMALDKCYQLTVKLNDLSTGIPYEDTQLIATDLMRCGTNLLTAINGPLQQRTNVLRVDTARANIFPEDYDTDIESEWSNLNSLADGNDFTEETLEQSRNVYQQKKLSNEMTTKVNQMISLLTSTLNLHINIGQNCQINTSEVFMSMETLSAQSLSNKSIEQVSNARIQLPMNFTANHNGPISLQSMIKPLASYGNARLQPNTNLSTTISLAMFDQNGNEISPMINMSNPITLTIPRDPNLAIPLMILQNVTSLNSTRHNQSFYYHYMNITSSFSISAHIEFRPLNTNLTYLLIYRLDEMPQWNQLDGWTIFKPSNLSTEGTYNYFIDNQQTASHRSVVFGIRELTPTEFLQFRTKSSSTNPPILNEKLNFSSDYELRLYTSGCYYLDENNNWKSDQMLVGPETNHYQTQCYTTQLKTFASSLAFLPKAIDWQYVFANADFMKNKTIYLTVISASVIYILLMIFARYKDRKDLQKLGVTPLADNHGEDQYFYQILVFTGQRNNAGTNSKVHFIIGGDDDQTAIRTFSDSHRKIFQRGSIDSFIMAVPKSLGLLNYIRIWHDNSGRGSSASWFLKYIIVRDLQTMQKFYFISQRWFAVEKGDGKIERVLTFANDQERRDFSYLLSKKTYHSISDGHLWFSIFSRPPSNRFTRVQRCTCCFVLLIFSMFLNIMYYQTSNETKTNNSTNTVGFYIGLLYISTQQIIIGIIVELFAFVPSILLVQFFRRIRTRGTQISPLHQALYSLKPPHSKSNAQPRKRKMELTFPWWCLFIAYGFCVILVSVSILFIIARGIEFGDLKSQQWLISIVTGFFSSIFLTQPLKIICLLIFFALFCRKDNDQELHEYIDENNGDLDDNEEYLHMKKRKSLFTYRPRVRCERLNEAQVEYARRERLKEIQMWSILREIFGYLSFLILISFIVYSNPQLNSFEQVQHLRKYFLNTRQIDNNYLKIGTIDDYWKWLEQSFTSNLRAQQWYNKASPRNLSGFINDKSNRLIGWATMRQLRIKSDPCSQQTLRSTCTHDYSLSIEDQDSYQPGWNNQTNEDYSSTIVKAFTYRSSKELDTYATIGSHGTYGGSGYVYEFRGRLSEIQSNLSILHRLSWIDNQTRAVIIQLTLYNPNVQLFTSVTFLAEFLSVGGIFTQARFEPIDLANFQSFPQLICTIIYMIFIIYMMLTEIRSLIHFNGNYFRQFWSFVEWSITICSWSCLGIYIWRYQESNRIYSLFKQTNGYVYINLQFASFINDLLTFLFSFCTFFGTIRLVRFCQYDQRLTLFIQTLQRAARELISFSLMFSIVFFAFLCLFYFLFISQIASCSTLSATAQMLFEMSLLKFDTSELLNAAPVLGPLCFTLYIFLVVFICMSMFLSIISDNFRLVRDNTKKVKEHILFYIWDRFLRTTGLRKPTEEELFEERDARMRGEYIDTIEYFPDKIDQLLDALNRIYMGQRRDLRLDI